MTADEPIDVQQFIDARGLSHVQVLLLVLCFVVVALDGFDIAAIGFIAPALRTEWGTTPAQLAPLFGAGLFGLMIGAFAFGRPFISNPDLVERFRNGWPLADPAPMSDWCSPTGGKGYTDFPAHALPSAQSSR